MNHIPIPTIAHDEAVLPNQPFFSWVRGHSVLLVTLIEAIIGMVGGLAAFVYYVRKGTEGTAESDWLKPERVSVLVDYAHILFIIIAIITLIRVINDNGRGSYRVGLVYKRIFEDEMPEDHKDRLDSGQRRLRKFKIWFLWFWLSMFCLYVFFAFQHTNTLKLEPPLTFFYLQPAAYGLPLTVNESDWHPPRLEVRLSGLELVEGLAFPFLVFCLNNLSILFIYLCYVVLYVPKESDKSKKKRRKLVWRGALAIGILTLLFLAILITGNPLLLERERDAYVTVFDALSGSVNAIIFALLIARLDSKLIGLKSWLISVLYCYAAVQPLFVVFGQQQSDVLKRIAASVLIFVLVSKIYFFLIVIYAMQTGRLLNYFYCFPTLSTNVKGGYAKATGQNEKSFWTGVEIVCKGVGVLALVYFLGSLIIYAGRLGGVAVLTQLSSWLSESIPHPSNAQVDLFQIGFCMVAIISLWWNRTRSDFIMNVNKIAEDIFPQSKQPPAVVLADRATDQLQRFKKYFLRFWIATFVLYLVLLMKHQQLNQLTLQKYFGATISNIILMASSEPLIDPQTLGGVVKVLSIPFATLFFSLMNLMFIFWCFVVLQSPVYGSESKADPKLREAQAETNTQPDFIAKPDVAAKPCAPTNPDAAATADAAAKKGTGKVTFARRLFEPLIRFFRDFNKRPRANPKLAAAKPDSTPKADTTKEPDSRDAKPDKAKPDADAKSDADVKNQVGKVAFARRLFEPVWHFLRDFTKRRRANPKPAAAKPDTTLKADTTEEPDPKDAKPDKAKPDTKPKPDADAKSEADIRRQVGKVAFARRLFGPVWHFLRDLPKRPRSNPKTVPNYSEARQKLLIHYSGFVVALVIAAFLLLLFPTGGTSSSTGNLRDYATVFDGLTGMLGAVALSLLIARLDSRLINLSPSLIFLFFAYAAIQPLLVVFELKAEVFRTIETTILTAAFFLKICFFLVTLKALRNGNIHIYFACFPFLHKRVDSIFENQFEIRTLREGDHSYVVSIWKKNHLVYLPETSFGSRGECDNWVHRFRELMNEEKNYDRGEESGTHWLKVVDPLKRKLVCESIALRSVEDADHLREESMEKIPHCKYDRT